MFTGLSMATEQPRTIFSIVFKGFWMTFFFTVIYSGLYSAWYCLINLYYLFFLDICVFSHVRSAYNPAVFKILTIINDLKVQYVKVWLGQE